MGDDISVTRNASRSRQTRQVLQIFVHPHYNRDTFENDIAIIRVRQQFQQTSTFSPMRRAFTRPIDNTTCRVGKFRIQGRLSFAR